MDICKNHEKSSNYKKDMKKAVKSLMILPKKWSLFRKIPIFNNFYIIFDIFNNGFNK